MMKTLEILDTLISFETTSNKSNLRLIKFVEEFLSQFGFRVNRLSSPCSTKAGIYAEIGPEIDGGILLSAHSDVVPTEGQNWSYPPFKLTPIDDRLYGRGTTDMKGFLASMLALASRVDHKKLPNPLALLITYDEEIGCVGLQQLKSQLTPLLRKPRLCVVGEPTEMQVASGHKGKTAYRATFTGQVGHSALAPKFDNALHIAADFMSGLRKMQKQLAKSGPFDFDYDIPFTTIHVGKLTGGKALNIVPNYAEMLFEIRYLDAQNTDDLIIHIDTIARHFDKDNGLRNVNIEIINNYPGFDVKPNHENIRKLISITNTNRIKVDFGTEAGILSQMSVPTLVCGPGSMSEQGHKADEFITKQQLFACDEFLTKLLA